LIGVLCRIGKKKAHRSGSVHVKDTAAAYRAASSMASPVCSTSLPKPCMVWQDERALAAMSRHAPAISRETRIRGVLPDMHLLGRMRMGFMAINRIAGRAPDP
jgi:hypothetical protein